MCDIEMTFEWCSKGQIVDSEWENGEKVDKRHRQQKVTCSYAKLQTISSGKKQNIQKIQMFIIHHFENPKTRGRKKKTLHCKPTLTPLKLYPYMTLKHVGESGIAPLILNHNTRWRCGQLHSPAISLMEKKPPTVTDRMPGGPQ